MEQKKRAQSKPKWMCLNCAQKLLNLTPSDTKKVGHWIENPKRSYVPKLCPSRSKVIKEKQTKPKTPSESTK